MSLGLGMDMELRIDEAKVFDKEAVKKHERIIDMMRHQAYPDGRFELSGLMEYMKQQRIDGRFSYYDMCIAYAQLMSEAVDNSNWILHCAEQIMSPAEKIRFHSMVENWGIKPVEEAVQNSKTDLLHERMRQGEWKPAQKTDISTEYLQRLRDAGMSYDKIANAVGMSKSGVAARLKGYKPRNANK